MPSYRLFDSVDYIQNRRVVLDELAFIAVAKSVHRHPSQVTFLIFKVCRFLFLLVLKNSWPDSGTWVSRLFENIWFDFGEMIAKAPEAEILRVWHPIFDTLTPFLPLPGVLCTIWRRISYACVHYVYWRPYDSNSFLMGCYRAPQSAPKSLKRLIFEILGVIWTPLEQKVIMLWVIN